MFKVNDEVKVKVNGRYVRGKILQIQDNNAQVIVPVHYGMSSSINVVAPLDKLLIVYRDYEHWKKINDTKTGK